MTSVARTAIVLLGLFWGMRGLATCADSAAGFLRFQRFDENPDWLADWLLAAALSGGTVLLLSLFPAFLLVVFSRQIAERLFSDRSIAAAVTPTSAYVVGCALLALFFLVQGAGSLIAGLVGGFGVLSSGPDAGQTLVVSPMVQATARGVVELAGGLLLYRHASSQRHPQGAA